MKAGMAAAAVWAAMAIGGGGAGTVRSCSAAEPGAKPAARPAVKVAPEDGQAVTGSAPVTFGLVFRAGEVPKGQDLEVRAGGWAGRAQVDAKRHYDDGSLRFAVVSLVAPGLEAAGLALETATVEAAPGPPAPQDAPAQDPAARKLLASDFDATVTLKFPDGRSVSASARKLLEAAGGKAEKWLSGPVATEWLLAGAPADAEGQADPDLNVQFQVRAYQGCPAVRVSVVVENCWDAWAGNIGYDLEVRLGKDGPAAFEKKNLDHRRLSRWRKVFWWGQAPRDLVVVPDRAGLIASGALPNYDLTLKVPEKSLAAAAAAWAKCNREILGNGLLCAYMPTTGGRAELAPYPVWTAQYLLSLDPRLGKLVLGQGELAGSWPIHVRSLRTRRPMSLDERPTFWMNGYKDGDGYERPKWQADRKKPEDKGLVLTPDVAHQGSFAYLPYLLTGDFYYLEEACFWGHYCLLAQWTAPRQGGKGLMSDQVRGDAWGLRNIADAGFIAPDGSPEAKFFEQRIRNNLAHLTGRMYGPPESSALGFWGQRTVEDARIGNAANPNWLITAPWEHDYLIWSLHHLAELGYPEAAKPRDFQLRWRVGVFTHAPDFNPLLGAPYRMVVGERGPDKKAAFYDDWKKLGEENARLNQPKLENYANCYTYSARAALVCGVDGGFPKADQALQYLESQMPNFRPILEADPYWALAPRPKAEAGR